MSMSMRHKRAIGSLVTYLMVIAAYLVVPVPAGQPAA